MENMVNFWNNKKVFITGHTGFKGGWLATVLSMYGAKIVGYSIDFPERYNAYSFCADRISTIQSDVRDYESLHSAIRDFAPDIIFHLAAQPLVLSSYNDPLLTYHTNVIGTANVLEAIRVINKPVTAIIITSDKCYLNLTEIPAHEEDSLGGKDPYSASKACAEVICDSYRRGFFAGSSIRLASARAGNVIGGGDWAESRLLPDCVRSWENGAPAVLRSPAAVRPWQYVLDIINSYMLLAERIYTDTDLNHCTAWNFGPSEPAWKVMDVVSEFARHYPANHGVIVDESANNNTKEAPMLMLNVDKAETNLGITNRLSTIESIEETARWYSASDKHQATSAAIERFYKCP